MSRPIVAWAAVAGLIFAGVSPTLAGTFTFTDDFDTPQDYATSLAWTIWDGLKITGDGGSAASLAACETTSHPGCLTFASSATATAAFKTDQAILYKTVPADLDFEATVKMVDGNWVPYPDYEYPAGTSGFVAWHSAGLTAAMDADDWVANFYFSHPEWGATFIGRSVDDGAEDNRNTDTGDPTKNIDDYPYTKLARVGNDFVRYYSPDGVTWTEFSRHTREDLAGVDLEVGLRHAMYSGNTASAVFDDFSLSLIPEPATLALVGLGALGTLLGRRRRKGERVERREEKAGPAAAAMATSEEEGR